MNVELLGRIGLTDPTDALNAIQRLAGNGVSDNDLSFLLPLLRDGLEESPDPDRSLQSFVRWFTAVGNPVSYLQSLLRHPVSLRLFCLVTGCSQYFADLLVRNPEYFEILANPGMRGGTKTVEQFTRELTSLTSVCQRVELKRDALRRWKAREMLRIGVRDLIGLAEMAQTAHEFSNLADACVQQALDIARFTLPLTSDPSVDRTPAEESRHAIDSHTCSLTVIGMGKLGGQELNYSSDIDLIFVCEDALPERVTRRRGASSTPIPICAGSRRPSSTRSQTIPPTGMSSASICACDRKDGLGRLCVRSPPAAPTMRAGLSPGSFKRC